MNNKKTIDYIIEPNKVSFEDYKIYSNNNQSKKTAIKKLFAQSTINPYTIKFLRAISRYFNPEDKKNTIEDYINYFSNPKKSKDIQELYNIFSECENAYLKKHSKWNIFTLKTKDISLMKLSKISEMQDFRRKYMGRDLADRLYGVEVKSREYEIKRRKIVFDNCFYGKEKEEKIQELNLAMWENKNITLKDIEKPFNLYQEKLLIYKKDLDEMDKDEKKKKIKEIRKEFFSSSIIKKLEKVDANLEEDEKLEKEYFDNQGSVDYVPDVEMCRRYQIRKGLNELIKKR